MTFGDEIDWAFEARRAAAADDVNGGPGIGRSDLVERLAELLPARGRLLDAGCNIGRYAPVIMAAGFDYTGVDQSIEAIEIACARNPAGNFACGFLWDMQFSEPFDAVTCFAVLQHNTLEEKERILPRIAAAIRPLGVLMLLESTLPEATRTQLTPDGWIELVTRHGFTLVETFHANEYGLHDAYVFRKATR
jgi:2-polyprenyl-3-methyl-5-hydroxy-6-metoxy-1,4-benzoquinol methylase